MPERKSWIWVRSPKPSATPPRAQAGEDRREGQSQALRNQGAGGQPDRGGEDPTNEKGEGLDALLCGRLEGVPQGHVHIPDELGPDHGDEEPD